MNLLEQFEYPLPRIACAPDKITVETQGRSEGSFILYNSGGGELSGSITSNSRAAAFFPERFNGAKAEIRYKIDMSGYKTGDIIQTSALVTSNGGELIIPVILKLTAPTLIAGADAEPGISTLKDFAAYAKTYPVQARRIFTQKEFFAWLEGMEYDNAALYSHMAADADKERGLDDFLTANGLKKKSALIPPKGSITVDAPAFSADAITGSFTLKRKGWGYIDVSIAAAAQPWLTLLKTKFSSRDFDDDGVCAVDYIVNPAKLRQRQETSELTVTSGGVSAKIPLTARIRQPFRASLSKTGFLYEDTGYIIIENYRGGEILVEVWTDCPFVRLEGRQYRVRDRAAQIPFYIKVGAVAAAGAVLRKHNVIYGSININADKRLYALAAAPRTADVLPFVIARPVVE